MNDKYNKK